MAKVGPDEISDENILYKKVRSSYKAYIKNDFLKNGKNYLAILKDKNNYLAALRLYDQGEFYLLEALETKPNYRRCGYGETLLREVLSFLKNGSELRSEVGLSNKKSLGLHKKIGFEIVGKKESHFILAYKVD